VVIDHYSRKTGGLIIGSRMKIQLVYDMLTMAIWKHRPSAGLIVHTDRGSQYTSKAYRKFLLANDIKGSMSRKGDCWDTIDSRAQSLLLIFVGIYQPLSNGHANT